MLQNEAAPSGPQYQQVQTGNLTIQLPPQPASKKSAQAPLTQQQLAQAQLPQPTLLTQKKKKKVSSNKHGKVSPKKHVKGVSRQALNPEDQAAKDKYDAQNERISFTMRIPEDGNIDKEKLIVKSPDYLEGKCCYLWFW